MLMHELVSKSKRDTRVTEIVDDRQNVESLRAGCHGDGYRAGIADDGGAERMGIIAP